MSSVRKPAITYELLYVIGIIAISFSSIFVRWSSADAAVTAMYRLYLTNALMLPLLWRFRREWLQLTLKQWGLLSISGVMLALHFLLWMASLSYTTVASSTVILTLEPVFVMIASFLLFGIKANRTMLLGMSIAMIGSIIIGSGDFSLSADALLGDVLSLLGAAAVAVHMMIGKQLRSESSLSAYVYNFSVFFIAASSLALYNLVRGNPFTGYSGQDWRAFLLLAIVPTLFGHYLFNWLLKYLNTTAVSMSVLGEPVIASVLAWILLNEELTVYQSAAGLLILFGVWLFIRHGKEAPA
ncbi:DMT family transporter [Paenibacillus xylaniclasticus]|uniref:DMT family transporter n=1 Tax=Paenibacillus xylaniclasticus TaxID=588083 RepID=UPI000FDC0BA9|nr:MULTISPECIES: DMT family transporter [Paenibacillus]GFN34052.1 multidrug transporter [Paenibacillus curdlanolyticus]